MEKNIYTFDNWLEGKICPNPSYIKSDNDNKNHSFPWTLFPDEELEKIRQAQEAIFIDKVEILFKKLMDVFQDMYENSKEKEILIEHEIIRLKEVLYSTNTPSMGLVSMNYSNSIFSADTLQGIRFYIKQNYVEAKQIDYSHIHSNQCNFKNTNDTHPYVEGEAFYRLLKYLYSIKSSKVMMYP
ncbi:MAG: hypothetical protein FGM46_09965 [Ferruginibacter sp.]|nr:hypothetical protein [Ferruginibacter sp.]